MYRLSPFSCFPPEHNEESGFVNTNMFVSPCVTEVRIPGNADNSAKPRAALYQPNTVCPTPKKADMWACRRKADDYPLWQRRCHLSLRSFKKNEALLACFYPYFTYINTVGGRDPLLFSKTQPRYPSREKRPGSAAAIGWTQEHLPAD
jgi:hypothetical protein